MDLARGCQVPGQGMWEGFNNGPGRIQLQHLPRPGPSGSRSNRV